MQRPNLCAWVSRHKPSRQQCAELGQFEVIFVGEGAYLSARECWATILQYTRRSPDLIVAVLPTLMLGELAEMVDPVPVIRTPGWKNPKTGQFFWDGTWHRVVGLQLKVRSWTPPEVMK